MSESDSLAPNTAFSTLSPDVAQTPVVSEAAPPVVAEAGGVKPLEAAVPPAITADSYAVFALPEGQVLNEALAAEFRIAAAGMGLTQDQAQSLVSMQAGVVQREMTAKAEQARTWEGEITADKVYGGDQFATSVASAARAMDKFSTPEVKVYLNDTGLGNHPGLFKMFVEIGKAMSEDGLVNTRFAPATTQKDHATRLYGS